MAADLCLYCVDLNNEDLALGQGLKQGSTVLECDGLT
jgi:hypothetical protein